MNKEINPKWNENVVELYKTQWRAHFKHGLGSPTIVYGNNMAEATANALAYFRKNNDNLGNWTANQIVDRVELVG